MIGCISYVNSYLSEEGLHRRNTLPPVIFDLYSPPPGDLQEEEEEEGEGEDMAHRRAKPIRKKKVHTLKTDHKLPAQVSNVITMANTIIECNIILFHLCRKLEQHWRSVKKKYSALNNLTLCFVFIGAHFRTLNLVLQAQLQTPYSSRYNQHLSMYMYSLVNMIHINHNWLYFVARHISRL